MRFVRCIMILVMLPLSTRTFSALCALRTSLDLPSMPCMIRLVVASYLLCLVSCFVPPQHLLQTVVYEAVPGDTSTSGSRSRWSPGQGRTPTSARGG